MNVKDFDPRLLELWRDAAHREVLLPTETREKAVNFAQRLYMLRKAMRLESHEWVDAANKVIVRKESLHPETGEWCAYAVESAHQKKYPDVKWKAWRVKMTAQDNSHEQILAAAGYSVPEAPSLDD